MKPRKRPCDCADPGCPVHKGTSQCPNAGRMKLWRIDMEDRDGAWFCYGCARDAHESGLFRMSGQ